MQAFLPGAGLGTRLRPLTDHLPKPLVPLFHRPLVEHALAACRAAGATSFAINTHHLADAWLAAFPTTDGPPLRGGNGEPARHSTWHDQAVALLHEPVLLETGGGVKNIEPWADPDTLLVHNADIFSTLQLDRLIDAHRASGAVVTMALRSTGPSLHVAIDASGQRVTDIRRLLDRADGSHQFTGIYCAEPALFPLIPANEKFLVIPAFLELIKAGQLGAVVLDDGAWFDLGNPASLLAAHLDPPADPGQPRIHPDAAIDPAASIDDLTWIGPGASVPAATTLTRSLVLPDATVTPGHHTDTIVLPNGTPLPLLITDH